MLDIITPWVGWAGFFLLLAAWVPQTWTTIKQGSTPLHAAFILLYVVSSGLLTIYAVLQDDLVFMMLNGLLTMGSGINLYYRFFPRQRTDPTRPEAQP